MAVLQARALKKARENILGIVTVPRRTGARRSRASTQARICRFDLLKHKRLPDFQCQCST